MSDSKKWTPIKIGNAEITEAINLIKQCVKIAHQDHGALDEKEIELIGKLLQHHEDLEYFMNTSAYLWATDVPDKVSDPDKVLFQIKFYDE